MKPIRKYPRTRHLQGSRMQTGDEDLPLVAFSEVANRHLVVEEKVDGANCAVSFDVNGRPWLQSRGHYLTGGHRERHFDLFKAWVSSHKAALWEALSCRYVMYGEWMHAKHTVFYDVLPHYFLEFDILDLNSDVFLSTQARRRLLENLPVVSVPVLHEGRLDTLNDLTALLAPSLYKSGKWRQHLADAARHARVDPERAARETDNGDLAEGLYIKIEDGNRVVDRLKWVRAGFSQALSNSGSHWQNRPIVFNGLAPGVDIMGGDS